MIDKENQNNIESVTVKPSFWGWLWFLVPWIIIIIVSVLFDPITFSPTLIIFAGTMTCVLVTHGLSIRNHKS